MPSLACRDTGSICDWFFSSDDTGEVIKAIFEHLLKVHPRRLKEVSNMPLWIVSFNIIKMIKGLQPQSCTVACRDLGLGDDWESKADDAVTALLEVQKHWESDHPKELKAEFEKRNYLIVLDFVNAIKK